MKYFISFITLAVANFLSLAEIIAVDGESLYKNRVKWQKFDNKARSLRIAIGAVDKYNKEYGTNYKYRRMEVAEKAVESPLKIRVYFVACSKKCNKKRRKKCVSTKKCCDHFRVTYLKAESGKGFETMVKKLTGPVQTKRPTTKRATTKRPTTARKTTKKSPKTTRRTTTKKPKKTKRPSTKTPKKPKRTKTKKPNGGKGKKPRVQIIIKKN
uniref:Basic tail protein n=1 Tax=Strongyloides venezuelensis TaxID=75913 RepID=A0A0K0EZR2_STRVS